MYNDLFTVFGLTVHGYGLMIGLGVLAALWMGCARAKARGLSDDTATTLVLLAVIIGFVGAKIFFVLTHFTDFLRDPWGSLGSEGFVVYGGIIFGAMACYVWLRRRKQSFLLWADILMPGVALAQGLGRVGCFLAGCCYGRPAGSCWGVVFPAGSMAPAGIRLIPTQLYSAAGDVLLCLALLIYDRKKHADGGVLALYLILYSIGRFLIEFLRSDARGSVGALSASQFIGLFVLSGAVVFALILRGKGGKKGETP